MTGVRTIRPRTEGRARPDGTGGAKAKPPKGNDDQTVFGQMHFPLLTERAFQDSGD